MCIHWHTLDVDLPQLKKKNQNTKMPKIVEVGYIVAMPDTLQNKISTAPSHYLNQCWCISADYSY